jgi:hypothetical protein
MFVLLFTLKVIGTGGFLGMSWNGAGGQQEAIDDFNSGRSNLLVATSVLEEGLDIESCEMVIIFSQSLNLIRLVVDLYKVIIQWKPLNVITVNVVSRLL